MHKPNGPRAGNYVSGRAFWHFPVTVAMGGGGCWQGFRRKLRNSQGLRAISSGAVHAPTGFRVGNYVSGRAFWHFPWTVVMGGGGCCQGFRRKQRNSQGLGEISSGTIHAQTGFRVGNYVSDRAFWHFLVAVVMGQGFPNRRKPVCTCFGLNSGNRR